MKKIAANLCAHIFMVSLIVLAFALDAHAHRVNVFAWLEGDRVVVECGFSRSQPVKNGQVTVYDNITNKELLQGRTDSRGRYVFSVPGVVRDGHGLRVEINAGQGHVSDWVMSAEELYDAAALTAGFDRAEIAARAIGQNTPARPQAPDLPMPAARSHDQVPPAATRQIRQVETAQAMPTQAATPEHVRQIVNESLDAKLSPLHQRMAAMESRGAGIVEIIGGIGWIIGLVGLWLYYRGRRKEDSN